ncbi:MAG: Bifunctional NMN adenylyltransferase/Nudix hydrolase [Bacteroidetes bacterium ADurb.Bin408]|nr:MAG: Bifunctional NMN adenylyltransferase/Nudix hydrolase [Bacteroidetes bacterium ADurb.Bin408]
MTFTYAYPRPMVTVDIIIIDNTVLSQRILLIKRGHDPFAGCYALPGGFVDEDESLEAAACRELKEETNIAHENLRQFRAFGDKGRDPRGHNVTVVFYGFVNPSETAAMAGDDAAALDWFPLDQLPPLAFDHKKIISLFASEIIQKSGV